MTIDEDIAWWKQQSKKAKSKETVLLAFAIAIGLQLAKADHRAR